MARARLAAAQLGAVGSAPAWPRQVRRSSGMAGALRGHERQHISRPHPPGRPAHRGEKHLQVIGHRCHRVRPAPASQELQVPIQQPNPSRTTSSPAAFRDRVRRTLEVEISSQTAAGETAREYFLGNVVNDDQGLAEAHPALDGGEELTHKGSLRSSGGDDHA
jgi:hypothetical protein